MKSTRQLLSSLGILGLIIGVLIFAYSWLVLRPLLSGVTRQVVTDLQDVTSVSESVRDNQSAEAIFGLLPNTFITLRGTLLDASSAMYSTAKTTNDVKKGLPGLIMPKTALNQDTNRLAKTGKQLDLLAGVIGEMQPSVEQLSSSLKQYPSRANSVSRRSEDLRSAIDRAAFPAQAALLGTTISFIFLFLGSCCLVLSKAVADFALTAVSKSELQNENHFVQSKSA